MTDFVSGIIKQVIGLGHNTEDGNPVPIIFRPATPMPLSGSGTPTPQKLSPYPAQNPLPK